ncbi:MAG: HEAT repeat domain-containing protein [Elusimicrobia bacterium]|nr:HEAT repeat domain-containing protein [Elusimicrobiota bacterium]
MGAPEPGQPASGGIQALIKTLTTGAEPQARREAALALGRMGPSARVAEALAGALAKDRDARVREFAALAFSKWGSPPRLAAGALVAALEDSDALVRREAIYALSMMSPLPAAACRGLLKALETSERPLRQAIASALGKLARPSAQVVKVLAGLKRSFRIYTLEITERCNEDCVFCFAAPRRLGAEGTHSTVETVKKQLQGIKKDGYEAVCFSGGEPTLHPDLPGLMRLAAEEGLSVELNTNALRFASKAYLDSFGPGRLKFNCRVSFHSHKEAVYDAMTGVKAYRAALAGIRALLGRDIPVNFSHVLNARNYRDFPGWVRFVEKNFAGAAADNKTVASVYFNQQVPDGRSMVPFKRVKPYLLEGARSTVIEVDYKTPCTASDCLFEEGFGRKAGDFSPATRRSNLARLKELPLPRQRELLEYFVPERCYSCRRFLNPFCKGIRKRYLLLFGYGEYPGLLSAEERRYVDALRRRPEPVADMREVRASPYVVLGAPASRSEGDVDALARTLGENPDQLLRREAARSLAARGPEAAGALEPLLRALEDQDKETRWEAARAIAGLGPLDERAAGPLLKALGDAEAVTRRYAAGALRSLRPSPPQALAALGKALADEDAQVRREAGLGLAELGPAARPAARELAKALLEDPDSQSRQNVALAFSRMEPPPAEAAEALVRALEDEEPQVRREAAYALSMMEPVPAEACPGLLEALEAGDGQLSWAVALAVGRMARPPKKALEALAKLAEHPDPKVAKEAAGALSRLGRA